MVDGFSVRIHTLATVAVTFVRLLKTFSRSTSPAAGKLILFAVKEEACPFQKLVRVRSDLRVLLTGIGPLNAEQAIRKVLSEQPPRSVLSCGFAGGLNPELATGTVVFSADDNFPLSTALLAAGA